MAFIVTAYDLKITLWQFFEAVLSVARAGEVQILE